MFNEILLFLFNVLHHWLALVTGGVIVLLIALYEYKKGKSVPWRRYQFIMGLALFVSCFMAWHDEHHTAEILKLEKSQLTNEKSALQAKLEGKQNEIDLLRDELTKRPAGTDDTKERQRRQAIRKQLGKLLGEGNALRNACDPLDKDMRWHNWSSKVERYLANNLGSDYVARFKAIEQFNTICWAGIGQEMDMLDEFIRDFQ
jgi:predicted secreted protein